MKVLEGNKVKVLTNSFVLQPGRVLLGMKKRGFGKGKYNGFGGKVEPGETVLQAAQREFSEEACIEMNDPLEIGTIYYKYEPSEQGEDPMELKVHVFVASAFTGEIKETEEMIPHWLSSDNIPFDKMWSDDIHWYSHLLKREKFSAYFHFEKDMKTLREKNVVLLNEGLDFLPQ
mmetsp:Transcript_6564/g.7944  ORF Transcript_6564/g.7944 Transcript_6564/m.7944 type:complete len:174 (-) Transcript_6564:762-1283(-)